MTATLIVAGFCAAGVGFMIRFLMAMRNEGAARHHRVERILPHNVIDWDIEVEESPSPGVKHAIPRRQSRSAETV
jgi:hypothetical protein